MYLQIRDALVKRIVSGAWKPGQAVPNEIDPAREFGVSPGTMRKALDRAESERLLTRRQGRGTFVNDLSSLDLASRYVALRRGNGEHLVGEVIAAQIDRGPANDMERGRRLDNPQTGAPAGIPART
jgi:GntR family transcriptional regulator